MKIIEYRVRPVTRYIVTRYEADDTSAGIETIGEFGNEGYAIRVKEALEVHDPHAEPLPPHAPPSDPS